MVDIGDRVLWRGKFATVVRYNVGDYLVFFDEPLDGEDTQWCKASELERVDY